MKLPAGIWAARETWYQNWTLAKQNTGSR